MTPKPKPRTYHPRPLPSVEALRFTGDNIEAINEWANGPGFDPNDDEQWDKMNCGGDENEVYGTDDACGRIGDWIVKHPDGRWLIYSDDEFTAAYTKWRTDPHVDLPATQPDRIPPMRADDFVWYWPNKRSRTTHAYVRGPGACDASMCGLPLMEMGYLSWLDANPRCRRCEIAVAGTLNESESA